ncbi:MAG: adenylate/guanylate cyclase domain-containing protein [Treponema sp.]|jgi:class 3 adenylate cyclase/HAMP domain-containing protein|nr:adenylate/guanylate cyclase domain-containing protein [Treponema sp.]
MKIRTKIFLVVLPVIVVTVGLSQTASYFRAVSGITRVAQQFLSFKASELRRYAESQWDLLAENNYDLRPDMAAAAKEAVMAYAAGMELGDTELTLALPYPAGETRSTRALELLPGEADKLLVLLQEEREGLEEAFIGGKLRVFRSFYFTPFQCYFVLCEEKTAFYTDAQKITVQTAITAALSLAAAAILLALFARRLTNPLSKVIGEMNRIISGGDLHGRVPVEYRDETGRLALTFNTMIGELDRAYEEIKRRALAAVLAQKKEQRIRTIFQKYVPKDLIDKYFSAPESMLVGDNRVLSILFSDIRGFTTISEGLAPDELVKSLNRYFSGQVDIIMNRSGIVDKYIGDAIMAFWGAPVQHEDDVLQSVEAGLDMIDAVRSFNIQQKEKGKTPFNIGIGINYGTVTVGNIGSDRKMDYTVIGDAVNLASRMEGLTKTYHEEILVSESVREALDQSGAKNSGAKLPLRLLDTVAVKGKTKGVKIYTVRRRLETPEEEAWNTHNEGMELYYRREFIRAAARFEEALRLLPGDFNAQNLAERCRAYALAPPGENWDGVEVMKTK